MNPRNPNIWKEASKGGKACAKSKTKKALHTWAVKAATIRWARAKMKKELDNLPKGVQ